MKYSRALDYVLAAIRAADKKDTVLAAKRFNRALAEPDLEKTVASLEKIQQILISRERRSGQEAKISLAEIARRKKMAKPTMAKPKKRPTARASFSSILDKMSESADVNDEVTLDDIEEDIDLDEEMPEATASGDDEDDEEMEDEEDEEDAGTDDDEEDEDEDDEDDEEEASDSDSTDDLEVDIEGDGDAVKSKKAKAKASVFQTSRVKQNIEALKRLKK